MASEGTTDTLVRRQIKCLSIEYVMRFLFEFEKVVISVSGSEISFDDGNDTWKVELTRLETQILDIILSNSSALSPISTKSIDEKYHNLTGQTLSLYSLKNALASIRQKTRMLARSSGGDYNQFNFIQNVNRIGYFCGLERQSDVREIEIKPYSALQILISCFMLKSASKLIFRYVTIAFFIYIFLFFISASAFFLDTKSYQGKFDDILFSLKNSVYLDICESDFNVLFEEIKLISDIYIESETGNCFISENKQVISVDLPVDIPFSVYQNINGANFHFVFSEDSLLDFISIRPLYINSLPPMISFTLDGGYLKFNDGKLTDPFYFFGKNIFSIEYLYFFFILSLVISKLLYSFLRYYSLLLKLKIKFHPVNDVSSGGVFSYDIHYTYSSSQTEFFLTTPKNIGFESNQIIFFLKVISNYINSQEVIRLGINIPISAIIDDEYYNEIILIVKSCDKIHFFIEVNDDYFNTDQCIRNKLDIRYSQLKEYSTLTLSNFDSGTNKTQVLETLKPEYVKVNTECLGLDSDFKDKLLIIQKLCFLHRANIIIGNVRTHKQSNALNELSCNLQQCSLELTSSK